MKKDIVFDRIGEEIKEIVYHYIKAESFTYSKGEKEAEGFFLNYFSKIPYFKKHQELYGAYPIFDDVFQRSVCWAMHKGNLSDTIVMIHHYDVVTIEDFKLLKPLAFSPDELEKELLKIKNTLQAEVQDDLESGNYLFGRGVCDMKGGGAIQMALLSYYTQLTDFEGNLIVIGVPDEENLSSGMRAAVILLSELQDKYGLQYKLMINSEPHQRKEFDKGVFSLGSVGKVMPFIYVRGSLAHAGKVFEGFNPLNLMSSIVRKTELNMELSDTVGEEASPPPTWLYLRDDKVNYDVSMPLSVSGCFSILTLNQTPSGILKKVKNICEEAFEEILTEMNDSYRQFQNATKQPIHKLPWEKKVIDFSALYQEAYEAYGEQFAQAYHKKMDMLHEKIKRNEMSLIACNFDLINFIYNYIDDLSPKIVYGLIPPYYPNVSNLFFENLGDSIKNIAEELNEFTMKEWEQEYIKEYFYTGISDLSYTSIGNVKQVTKSLEDSMPFFGKMYNIPAASIEKISMPVINIGPWGKDFHKLTERVLKEDLYERTPRIIKHAIDRTLKQLV
ncbi:M20/M25/M40 family metallo-hydrolase [Sinanaerobacter sp. ZZT-01]|uniref:M20/M25/M40 family metallo-hydrolase n=1 Tax=Sinanaerobacter sp. ZZT-01 TaxID=3111540 RepID=UPI002D794165|nr:M20/M25/M40 family metallo-hydrolase [Sinanaerobacter sp. ZZT-01]WRR92238.1 M20/M25/M40 family metallo-hydrolase [Sinanaerobacter sp. ZZT-01]